MDLNGIVIENIRFTRYESRKTIGLQAFASIRLNGVVAIQDIRIMRTEENFLHAMLPTRMIRTKCRECNASVETRYLFCPNCAAEQTRVQARPENKEHYSIVYFIDKTHADHVRAMIIKEYKSWLGSVWGEPEEPEGEGGRTHLRLSMRRGQKLMIGDISVTFLEHGNGPTKTGLFECSMGPKSYMIELHEKKPFVIAPEVTIRYGRRGASSCEVFISAPAQVKIDRWRNAEESKVGNHD